MVFLDIRTAPHTVLHHQLHGGLGGLGWLGQVKGAERVGCSSDAESLGWLAGKIGETARCLELRKFCCCGWMADWKWFNYV